MSFDMPWTTIRYGCAIVLALWALQGLRMVLVYLGSVHSPVGIAPSLPLATRSLARSGSSAAYSILLFCFSRPLPLAIAFVAFWVVRLTTRNLLRRLWFRYLAHVLLETQRQSDPSAVQETSGPRFEEALHEAYKFIEAAHAPLSTMGKRGQTGQC